MLFAENQKQLIALIYRFRQVPHFLSFTRRIIRKVSTTKQTI